MSDAAIGRAIGRDSSLIHQVARGTKPGRNLEGALDALVKGRKPKQPERRRAKSGKAARVRDGQVKDLKISAKDMLRTLRAMEARGQNVTVEADWENIVGYSSGGIVNSSGRTAIFQKGGYSARNLANRLERFMKAHPSMSDADMASEFMRREFQRRATPKGRRVRYSEKSPMFTGLRSMTFTKKDGPRKRPARGSGSVR